MLTRSPQQNLILIALLSTALALLLLADQLG